MFDLEASLVSLCSGVLLCLFCLEPLFPGEFHNILPGSTLFRLLFVQRPVLLRGNKEVQINRTGRRTNSNLKYGPKVDWPCLFVTVVHVV